MNNFWRFLTAILMICSVTICAGCNEVEKKYTYTIISQDKARKMMAENPDAIILDVRIPQEYDGKHIANSILLPLEDLRKGDFSKIPDKNALIMVYCWSGPRSKDAAAILAEKGYKRVYEFGGIKDWTGPLEGKRVEK